MRRALAATLAAALLLLGARPATPSVDLAHATWTRQGVVPASPPVVEEGPGSAAVVELAFDTAGVRWACEFTTADAATRRLHLRWRGAPDGLLFEVVLDGQRLSPPRDGWRPGARDLVSDLGGVWLGRGAHLFEVVAREQPPDGVGRLRLAALELDEP